MLLCRTLLLALVFAVATGCQSQHRSFHGFIGPDSQLKQVHSIVKYDISSSRSFSSPEQSREHADLFSLKQDTVGIGSFVFVSDSEHPKNALGDGTHLIKNAYFVFSPHDRHISKQFLIEDEANRVERDWAIPLSGSFVVERWDDQRDVVIRIHAHSTKPRNLRVEGVVVIYKEKSSPNLSDGISVFFQVVTLPITGPLMLFGVVKFE